MRVEVEMDQDPASVGEVYIVRDQARYSIASIVWGKQGHRDCEIIVIYDGIKLAPDELVKVVDRLVRKICKKWGYTNICVKHVR